MRAPQHLVNVEAVSADEGLFQELPGHFETDPLQIGRRSESQVREFINVKSKFGANVGVRAFAISDRISEFLPEFGKFQSRSRIDSLQMSDRVAQIVG